MSKVNQYDEALKRSLVARYQAGRSKSEISKEYDISLSTLDKWIEQYYEVKLEDGSVLNFKQVQELQKKNAELEEENIILRKASTIFSKDV